MPTVYVDNVPLDLDADHNLLEALLAEGVDLPYFCWHPDMGSVGACRQCAVLQYRDADDTTGRIVMSCMTPITDGARFSVAAASAKAFRTSVIENLMINHPHDCPVCEEGGECHLQDMTVMAGHRNREYRNTKTTFDNQYLGPLIGHEMNRCITCYRCVRFYQDYAGGHDLAAFASRDRVFFGREQDGVLSNEFAGNLVEVCPTGVFTDKTLSRHYTRKWDLQSAPSVCVGCSLGCNTIPSERYGQLRRVHNRYNHRVNGYFLCDRGRYGAAFVNDAERIPYVGIREGNVFEAVKPTNGLDKLAGLMNSARIVGIGSPRAGIEANFLLKKLVGEQNFFAGTSAADSRLNQLVVEVLTTTRAVLPSLHETDDYDAILVLGEDTTNHAPRLALSLRQAVRHRSKDLATSAGIPLWHDAAVRKIGQQEYSPLIIATPTSDRLDDVAAESVRELPDEIARLGYQIAAAIGGDEAPGRARRIAQWLKQAKRPLVVSGTSLVNEEVIRAAANVANALSAHNDQAGIMLCPDECNSLGNTLLTPSDPGLEGLLAGDQIDIALVLENDLARRLGPGDFSRLLGKVNQLVVIDHIDTGTASQANIVLPAATFAESENTYINNEGTAQRAFAVFKPAFDIAPAWHWLARLGQLVGQRDFNKLNHIDDILSLCEAECPQLQGIAAAAPDARFRIDGARIPRMTHRASGRTAVLANVSVHEPMQPADTESALAFTMEGSNVNQPSALRTFTWSPGWNSNQSIGKFQEEIGGPMRGGDPGVRVLRSQQGEPITYEPAVTDTEELILVRRHHIFGSEELSAHAAAIGELAPRPYCAIAPSVAETMAVATGDGIACTVDGETYTFEVVVDESIADGCVAYSYGLPETSALAQLRSADFTRAQDWIRPEAAPGIITSDRTP